MRGVVRIFEIGERSGSCQKFTKDIGNVKARAPRVAISASFIPRNSGTRENNFFKKGVTKIIPATAKNESWKLTS
jgi:hypothetical protein